MENNPPTTKFNIGSSRGDGGGGDYRVSRRGYVRAPRPTTQLCSRFKEIPLSTQRAQPLAGLSSRADVARRTESRLHHRGIHPTDERGRCAAAAPRAFASQRPTSTDALSLICLGQDPRARALACFTRRRRHPERSSTGGVEQLVVSRHCAHRAPGLPLYPQTRYASVHRVAPRRPAGLAGSEVSV